MSNSFTAPNVERTSGATSTTADVITETKDNLTKLRAFESHTNFMNGNSVYTELEQAYGKYLFVPYDIPRININDIDKFIFYFNNNAKHASKTQSDLSSGTFVATNRTYKTIDSISPDWTPVWSLNSMEQTYTEFPEIFEQVHDYMPWVGGKNFRWNMWSSSSHVPAHRDHTSMIDAPLAMRVKLFDNNIAETLHLLTDPIKEHTNKYITIPRLSESNSFAWNNLRTKHRSIKSPGRMKVLLIWRDRLITSQQVNQYVDLLDRSIAKYKDTPHLWVDDNSATDYLDLN
jgi:hypothetical protein